LTATPRVNREQNATHSWLNVIPNMVVAEKKFDSTKHILVPKHTILSEEETQKLLSHYNISKVQLPIIASNDPAIKAMELQRGVVVKVERSDAHKTTYYRLVD
jgi:DNA-directed RNA polymerase subunit H